MNAHLAEYRPCRIAASSFCLIISLLQQFPFARGVAAVALGGDVLGQKARTVSRATILPPIAAWIGTWNSTKWRITLR
jgi:hypothetical protein